MKFFAAALAVLVFAGCKSSTSVDIGSSNPTFEITDNGVKFAGEYIRAKEAPKILKDNEVPQSRVIYIRVEDFEEFASDASKDTFNEGKVAVNNSRRMKDARAFMTLLWYSGYRKSVLVTKERSTSWSLNEATDDETFYEEVDMGEKVLEPNPKPKPVQIRYRSSSEDDDDED